MSCRGRQWLQKLLVTGLYEEPPHVLNKEALEIALIVALLVKAKTIDEIHVMRKTVIDGSNTSGFQRTCVVALRGEVEVEGKRVPIQHISLEEDAARKMGEEDAVIRYRIDRLGIPLIEVTTAPVINSPQEAERTALSIGRILRATGRVKRGLGTIRQDINISIRDGALIEIKGVQELGLVSKVVECEVQRQLNLLKMRDELIKRGVKEEDVKDKFVDVTSIFKQTKCRVIQKALNNKERVTAFKLPKFAGLLKKELIPGVRFGTEMLNVARFWGRVKGIFHTDELPAYGITVEEISQLKHTMKMESQDAIVFVADTPQNAEDALKAIGHRVREAIVGVPKETRMANQDGTTRYMRPRPGAARMYPETDVPPTKVTEECLKELKVYLPELPEEKMKRLMKQYNLNLKLARQILDSEHINLFETIAQETKVSPTTIAVTLTETLKALKRDGIEIKKITDEQIKNLFHLIDSEKITKEAIPNVLNWLSKHEGKNVTDSVKSLGLTMISRKELKKMIENLIKENKSFVQKRGRSAFSPLMGMIMKKVRGQAKAKLVSEILKSRLEEFLLKKKKK